MEDRSEGSQMSLSEGASYQINECTQGFGDSQLATQMSVNSVNDMGVGEEGEHVLNIWATLKRHSDHTVFSLVHREVDGVRDSYTIGRETTNDIVIKDKRISSTHCRIFCDYESARIKIFIEDSSRNGTFINNGLVRIQAGERMELKSGDEIYLINPNKKSEAEAVTMNSFLFINMRERNSSRRPILAPGPTQASRGGTRHCHIEDNYVIGDEIGSGMCGTVHECIHRATGEHYAVKIIDTRKFAMTPGLSANEIREEANLMKSLNHKNIIQIKDTYELDHWIFIVMEYLRGGDLFDRILERERYSEDNARLVMTRILNAVDYLHSNEICHRDLKPENILLTDKSDDCSIKITDFGLAKRTNQEGLKTFCGTPQYFAPEVLKRRGTVTGSGRYGMSADMWSLGVVSYILLSGQFPFQEESLFEQIENATYSLTGKEWHGISTEAKHFIRSLMVLRTDQRMSVKEALKHPWILGTTMPKRELSSVISGAASTVPSASAKRQASIRGKKLTANTGAMKKHATVFSQCNDVGEPKSTDMSNFVSRSTSTFQPLTSGPSRVLFWSLRTSAQGLSRSNSASNSSWSRQNHSSPESFKEQVPPAVVSGAEFLTSAESTSDHTTEREAIRVDSIQKVAETGTAKKRKRKTGSKISLSESCFGSTKELSDDGIGEFSTDDEAIADGKDSEGVLQKHINEYFTTGTLNSSVSQISSPTSTSFVKVKTATPISAKKTKIQKPGKKVVTHSPNKKARGNGSLEAAWNRAELKKSKSMVSHSGGEAQISLSERKPMRTISDAFRNF